MAILTDLTYGEVIEMFDFFMSDRAGDADAGLDELGVKNEKRLKCNAHILVAVDQAMDKVFRDTEAALGVQNLIGLNASHVFSTGKNYI